VIAYPSVASSVAAGCHLGSQVSPLLLANKTMNLSRWRSTLPSVRVITGVVALSAFAVLMLYGAFYDAKWGWHNDHHAILFASKYARVSIGYVHMEGDRPIRDIRFRPGAVNIRGSVSAGFGFANAGGRMWSRSLGFFYWSAQESRPGRNNSVRTVDIPHWFLVVLILSVFFLPPYLRHRRKRRRARSGLCPTCGYDLRESPDQCPECGAVAGKKLAAST
jgi:hypothetical protein